MDIKELTELINKSDNMTEVNRSFTFLLEQGYMFNLHETVESKKIVMRQTRFILNFPETVIFTPKQRYFIDFKMIANRIKNIDTKNKINEITMYLCEYVGYKINIEKIMKYWKDKGEFNYLNLVYRKSN